jgi:hypothetical protein
LLRLGGELGRDRLAVELHALRGVVPVDRLHGDQVDDAGELVLGADRQLDRHRVALQPGADVLVGLEERGADAVHLVDEGESRHAVLVRLAPHRFRLRLDPGHGVVHHAGAVEHAQAALDLDGEVDVPRRVDDVDAVLGIGEVHSLPEAGRGRGGDGDAALLLLLHPVHGGGAVVDLADLVVHAGVEEDALGRGRLPGVDVRRDADVPITLDRCFACHGHFLRT